MSEIKIYDYDVQKLYLELLLSNPETYSRCESIFDTELFDNKLKETASYIKTYTDENKVLPTYEMVNTITKVELSKYDDLKDNHYDWLLKEFEQFIRHKALERAILQSAEHLQVGEYGIVEQLIKEASDISLTKDVGIDYWIDPKTRLERLKNSNGQISTGWKYLDEKLYGGFNRGELEIFAGPSNSGKSLFLANIALNCALQGLNVIYITHELSEELVAMRMDAMLTGFSTREIYKNLDSVEVKLGIYSKSAGDLMIKFIPAGKTVREISSYLKEYEVIRNKKADVICHDYLDLLYPKSGKIKASELFVKDKFVSEELRNLAMEKGICVVSASQLNRCLRLNTKVIEKNKGEIDIIDLKVGDCVKSKNSFNIVKSITNPVKQHVYRITTKSGQKIECSANHVFPTDHGELSIRTGLKIGSMLNVQTNNNKQY